jgi:hypothetical protein
MRIFKNSDKASQNSKKTQFWLDISIFSLANREMQENYRHEWKKLR